jgi:hypothetical protein
MRRLSGNCRQISKVGLEQPQHAGARIPAVIGRRLKCMVPFTAIDVIWLLP